MQNLALTSQFGNSGRRGNSSSNSFNSLVLNGVLPPSEDGRVEVNEGIKAPPKKSEKIIFPDKTPDGFGFPDGKPGDGDFGKERKWAQEQDGYRSPDNSGHYIIPPNTYVNPRSWGSILMEEWERKQNQPETEEEKERREYGYKIVDNLKELSKLVNIGVAYNGGIDFFNDFFGLNVRQKIELNQPNYKEFNDTIFYLIEDLLTSIDYDWIRIFVQKEENKNKIYSAKKVFQEWNPPLIIKAHGWSDNTVEKIIMEMIVLFIDGSPYLQIIMTIQRSSNVSTSKVIYSKRLD